MCPVSRWFGHGLSVTNIVVSAPAETMQHTVYHGDPDPGFRGWRQPFVVFAETAPQEGRRAKPLESGSRDPATGQAFIVLHVGVVADDVQSPVRQTL